jgi:hypothetical protein
VGPVNTRGPGEPPGFAAIRNQYWARRVWLGQLEGRIQMTDSGLAWLMRVKAI